MWDSLVAFCNWLQNTPVGLAVGSTLWGYPFVQLTHFFGLSLWVGTITMLDLRVLGLTGRSYSLAEFSDQLFPWTWTGLAIAVTGGGLLFSAASENYLYNRAFQVKFPLVLTGILYHIAILRKIRKWNAAPVTAMAKAAVIVEFLIWVGVVTAAVNIP